jgi:hypothetical protein
MKEALTGQSKNLLRVLQNDSGISPAYRHGPKQVTPGDVIEPPGVVLKWYAVHPQDRPVPEEITQLARSYLLKSELDARGFGFVILHRCGEDFYFLIVSTWRGNNEIWETVFYKNGDAMTDFALWPREAVHKPTFCVWELVPVWHEQKTWERFLNSPRDEAAAAVWLRDCYAGQAP